MKNNLHALHVWIFQRVKRFVDLLHTDAVVTNLPRLYKVIEHPENFGTRIEFCGRAVQLQQIEAVRLQISEAILDTFIKVPSLVAIQRFVWGVVALLWWLR